MAEDSTTAPPPSQFHRGRELKYLEFDCRKKTVKIRTLSGIFRKIGLELNNDSLEKKRFQLLSELSPPRMCQF